MNNKSLFNDEFLNMMSVIGFAIGLYNLDLNEKQTSNDELEEKLNEQNEVFLKTIIKQNNKIIELLERK